MTEKYTECKHCGGRAWMCEVHPDEPFEHLILGRECPGPGDPCPVCNPSLHRRRTAEEKAARIKWLGYTTL